MPLDGLPLVVEPGYPRAAELMAIGGKPKPDVEDRRKVRNTFWSSKMRSQIVVWEDETGRVDWGLIPGVHGAKFMLKTLFASAAWGIEQEARAVQTLAGLVRHHQFKQYMLTGMFMERSARSGLTYLFRRLRPTVAIDARSGSEDGDALIIACLCLHPIGYYDGSWAGAMCPTDDVIAHLMLMRGDEPMFWRRSNQHPPWHPAAGL